MKAKTVNETRRLQKPAMHNINMHKYMHAWPFRVHEFYGLFSMAALLCVLKTHQPLFIVTHANARRTFSECLILGSAGEVWKDMMQI